MVEAPTKDSAASIADELTAVVRSELA
jgi:hypothetical protein